MHTTLTAVLSVNLAYWKGVLPIEEPEFCKSVLPSICSCLDFLGCFAQPLFSVFFFVDEFVFKANNSTEKIQIIQNNIQCCANHLIQFLLLRAIHFCIINLYGHLYSYRCVHCTSIIINPSFKSITYIIDTSYASHWPMWLIHLA